MISTICFIISNIIFIFLSFNYRLKNIKLKNQIKQIIKKAEKTLDEFEIKLEKELEKAKEEGIKIGKNN